MERSEIFISSTQSIPCIEGRAQGKHFRDSFFCFKTLVQFGYYFT